VRAANRDDTQPADSSPDRLLPVGRACRGTPHPRDPIRLAADMLLGALALIPLSAARA
jgi:hypothetical protein